MKQMQPRTIQAYVGFKSGSQILPFVPASQRASLNDAVNSSVSRARSQTATRKQVTKMPIGVPKVPYKSPRDGGWQWVDLWNCLYRERIIFLSQPVNEELGNQLVATMLYLDSENHKDMNLYINCSGGEVVPCLALHDTMRHVKSDVATIGFGGTLGMSGFLLAMGQRGKRFCLPNTRIMLHHPSGAARGQASDIHREAKELLRIRDYMDHLIAQQSNMDEDTVARDLLRNKYFTPQEALNYGIIDTIVKPRKGVLAKVA